MALGLPEMIAIVLALSRSPRLPRSGLSGIGALPPARPAKVAMKGKGCGQQHRYQYASHLEWPVKPPQAPPHVTPPCGGPTQLRNTHTGVADPQRLDTHPRRAVQEMHTFDCRTCAQRGAVLTVVRYWGGRMITIG